MRQTPTGGIVEGRFRKTCDLFQRAIREDQSEDHCRDQAQDATYKNRCPKWSAHFDSESAIRGPGYQDWKSRDGCRGEDRMRQTFFMSMTCAAGHVRAGPDDWFEGRNGLETMSVPLSMQRVSVTSMVP